MITAAIYVSLIAGVGLAFVNYAFSRVFARRDPAQSRFYFLISLGWSANVMYLLYIVQLSKPHSPTPYQHFIIVFLNVATYIFFTVAAKWQLGQQWRRYIPPPFMYTLLGLTLLVPFTSIFPFVHQRYFDILPLVVGVGSIAGIAANYKMHLDQVSFRISRNTRMALVYSMYAYAALQLLLLCLPPYWSSGMPEWLPYVGGATCKGLHVLGIMSYGQHLIAVYERDAMRLRERSHELTHAQNAKRMVSLLAHELSGEILQLRLMLDEGAKSGNPTAATSPDRIVPLVEHVQSVINGFLVWYRETDPRGNQKPPVVIQANHVCDAAILGVKVFLQKGDKIRRQYAANTRFRAVETEIYQSVRNIMKNAVEAVETRWAGTKHSGVVVVETQVVIDKGKSVVKIIIEDNGTGIPPDIRPMVFQDGFSTKGSEGRGHGLAVASQFVKRWGGQIALEESTLGGAKFVLWFPHADQTGGIA